MEWNVSKLRLNLDHMEARDESTFVANNRVDSVNHNN